LIYTNERTLAQYEFQLNLNLWYKTCCVLYLSDFPKRLKFVENFPLRGP